MEGSREPAESFESSGALDDALRKISGLSAGGSFLEERRNTRPASFSSQQSEEEVSPLVPIQAGDDWSRARMRNPAVSYDVESHDPFVAKEEHRTSNFATMMHLIKGNIGTGILAMPKAVSNAGLLVGTIGIPILGIICVHCMHLLVQCSKKLSRKIGMSSLDYSSTAEQAFRFGPRKLQPLAGLARMCVNTMLMLTQFGFCCVYFLFVSKSIFKVVEATSSTKSSPISMKVYLLILLVPMILYNFIRNLKKLSPASIVANILQSVGLCIVFYYLIKDVSQAPMPPLTAPLSKLPLYFGTAMYAFEGIGVVLPLENAMATPEDFGGLNGVLNTTMVIVACLYTAVGFYGFLKYGQDVSDSITFNIDVPYVGEVIRMMFAVAIFLSYALQMYVPLQIIWPWLKKRFSLERFSERTQLIFELGLRAHLVLITFVLAIAIPMLDLFISLVGALASASLALIFPPILELVTIWKSEMSGKKFAVILVKDILIMSFGIIGSVIGTYTVVKEIVTCFQTHCE